jgi:glycosyltransferase involved in cell wall biosynthesis
MKISLLSRAPFLGGAEVACERLALGLQQLGHDVSVIVNERNIVHDRYCEAGIRSHMYRLPLREKRTVLSYAYHWMRLFSFLKSLKPDIVHSNDLPTHQFASSVASRLKIPIICHHRFIYDGQCINWLNRHRAHLHLFVSQFLMNLLSNHSSLLNSQPRQVVYDGLPLGDRVTDSMRLDARRKLGIVAGKRVVLFAGQVIERKGVKELIDAWQILSLDTDNIELIIVGDDIQNGGEYRKEMEAYARGMGGAVRFLGFQKNVPDLLKAADIAVVPSREEPLGNATLEAMATGLPVIGTRTGGIPEMVVHEQTGLLVPVQAPQELASAMRKLLANRSLALRLGEAGRLRCEQFFDLPGHVKAIEGIYEMLILQKGQVS